MGEALAEAEKAAADKEVPVGAVVVSAGGRVLSRAHNESVGLSDPCAHAEILALRRAGEAAGNYRLDNTFLIVTLEPCLMCVGALVHARVAGVVFGAADLKAGSVASCIEGFALPWLNHRPWHMGGVRSEECAGLLKSFFRERGA